MTAHNCTTHDPDCFRCDLSRDEVNRAALIADLDTAIEALRQIAAVREVIAHARRISPSPSMHVYVADLERALGLGTARPHKTGQRDGEAS